MTLDTYTPSSVTVSSVTPVQIDKSRALAKYRELCAIRDAVNKQVAPLIEQQEASAKEAEKHRVRSMEFAAKVSAIRGNKWRALKKEIGLLAKVTSGVLPPTDRDLELAAAILEGN